MGKNRSSGLYREYWRRVICQAHIRKSLHKGATDNHHFCFFYKYLCDNFHRAVELTFRVHLTAKLFSAEMKLCSIHIKNLIILSVSGIFKGFKNWQKVAEICYQLVHERASRGLALFLIWHHRLIYMALTLCEHACKSVCDVKSGIDPCPSPARSWTNW